MRKHGGAIVEEGAGRNEESSGEHLAAHWEASVWEASVWRA